MSKPKEKIRLDDKTAAVFDKKGYEVSTKISEGAFGQVYKAIKIKTKPGDEPPEGTKVAVKVMHISKIPKIVHDKFLPREFEAATTIRHKYVLEVFDIIKSGGAYYIFMEYAPNGNLMTHCKKGPIKEKQTKHWFRQCTQGLDAMHNVYKICHRDIKPENILLDENDDCKLSDFGFAKSFKEEGIEPEPDESFTKTVCGTFPFYSPELVKPRGKYNPFAADVWAMGVTLYIMLCSDFPFKPLPRGIKDKLGMERMYQQQQAGFRIRRGITISDDAENLLERCMEPRVNRRYTVQKMLRHSWLRENKSD